MERRGLERRRGRSRRGDGSTQFCHLLVSGVVFEIPIALRGFEMSWCENIFFVLVIKSLSAFFLHFLQGHRKTLWHFVGDGGGKETSPEASASK